MITIREYFGAHKPDAARHVQNAGVLVRAVNRLLDSAGAAGVTIRVNPYTGSNISGQQWGGYRTQACVIGAAQSAHKTGEAVDIYDPAEALDDWLTDDILEKHGLYREHPEDTEHWCHLSTRAPKSGRRTFKP